MQREPEPLYKFKHAITQDVAYGTLLFERRRELHGLVARAMEDVYGKELEPHLEQLAHHYSRSDDDEKAVHYLERAGDKASASFSMAQAIAQYRAAIGALDAMRRDPRRTERRIDLALKWSLAGLYIPSQELLEALQTSLSLAEEVADGGRAALCTYWIGWTHYTLGEHVDAIRHFKRAVDMADPGNTRLLAQLYCNLGQNYVSAAEYDEARSYLEKGLELRRGSDPEGWRTIGMAYSVAQLGMIHADAGAFSTAYRHLDEAIETIEGPGRRAARGLVLNVLGIVQLMQGDFEACLQTVAECRKIGEAIGSVQIEAASYTMEGYCRFHGARDFAGLDLLVLGVELLESGRTMIMASWNEALLAEALALAGNSERAEIYARRALERRKFKDRLGEITAHRAIALAAARRPTPDRRLAARHIREAMKLAEARRSRREVAITNFRYARVRRDAGDPRAAREDVARALAAFEELGMPWYADEARQLAASL